MSAQFELSIMTPDKKFYSGDVESLVLTSTEGEMGVLASHLLMVVALDTAPIRFKTEKGWETAAISGGFAQIKGTNVVVFTNTAEWPEDIVENRARDAKKRAEELLRSRLNETEYLQAMVSLQRAITRLRVVNNK